MCFPNPTRHDVLTLSLNVLLILHHHQMYSRDLTSKPVHDVRDWSLIMGRGLQNERGGGVYQFITPTKKKGWRKGFSHARRGGGRTGFEEVLKWDTRRFSHVEGGAKSCYPFKGWGHKKLYPVSRGGGGVHNIFQTCNFQICSNPSPPPSN